MSDTVLSLSQRPHRLSDLVGQDTTVKAIRNQMAKRPPRTWLFSGEPGTGKTTIAQILSVAFQCEHMKLWGDPCDACWRMRKQFAIHEINASEHSGVDDLERIAELSMHRPMLGQKRVIVLDEVHSVSKTAFSAILTPMEEPPEFTVWILLTSELRKVPAANQRRCTKYQLRLLGISETEQFLRAQATKAGITRGLEPLIECVHQVGIGAPGVLLQALEKYAAGAAANDAVAGTDGSTVDSLRICKAVTNGDWKAVAAALKEASADEARWIRASIAGWLKGVMARESSSAGLDRASTSILELCSPPLDDSTMMHWLWAILYRICKKYQGAGR